jgi:putative DNA primase/helicase
MTPDFDAARQFFAALGKPKGTIRLRGFYAKTDPRKGADHGAKGDPTKPLVQSWVDDGRGVYVVINNGGDKDADITECIAFFCEWDDRPKEWQITAWQELGLPEPTIQVDTGGKSIHSYWVLSEPLAPDAWKTIQTRLLNHADADRALKNPGRVMRLPGMPHPETGENAKIVSLGNQRYTADAIAACLPAPEPVADVRHEQARIFTDYEAQGLDEIQRALQCIPPRVPGGNTYPIYRNILWGLIAAVEEAGASRDTAISMMASHSPQWSGIDQVAGSGGADVSAGTFWYWAKEHGYRFPMKPSRKADLIRARRERLIAPGPVETSAVEPDVEDSESDSGPAVELVEITESPAKQSTKRKQRKPGILEGMPFRCLGFDRGVYFYLPEKAGQVTALTPAQHGKNYLITLAPLELWVRSFGSENDKGQVLIDWTSAADTLIGACTEVGVYDPARVRGRGAWTDAGRVIFHVGKALIVDGKRLPITDMPEDFGSAYFYEHTKDLLGPAEEPMSDDLAMKVVQIAERFRWETPASANMLLGWIVLAPVCGALEWRPHIWVTGGAGTGKTTILKNFMKPLLGGIYEAATGGTTEAGLRGQLKSDAIPVVFDEFEQNEQAQKVMVQNVLSLARVASSEGGKIYKGTTSGGSNSFEIRSMFCVSSINVALFQKADLDRFCVLPLRKDQMDKDDWTKFETEIAGVASIENGRALIARTLKQIPTIKANTKIIAKALGERFGQRFGDQYGTLLAGAWSLEAKGGGKIDIDTARQWIAQMDWDSREAEESDADEVKCRDAILQHLVDHAVGQRAQLGEMVECVISGQPLRATTAIELSQILGRWGLKVLRRGHDQLPGTTDFCTKNYLAVAHNNRQLATIFKETQWANNAHRAALKRLPGATASAKPLHFSGIGTHRATLVPLETGET